MAGIFTKLRYSSWWPRAIAITACLVLMGGVATALILWRSRSSTEKLSLDVEAAREIAEDILKNTMSLAEKGLGPRLSGDPDYLLIQQQESLAYIEGERDRTEILLERLGEIPTGDDEARVAGLEAVLNELAVSQSSLENVMLDAGVLLGELSDIYAADAVYKQGRQELLSAVESHNRAAVSPPYDLADARSKAAAAIALLQQAETQMRSSAGEDLDPEAPLAAISSLKSAAQRFDEACGRAEAEDYEAHNGLMQEVQTALSGAPASSIETLDIAALLQASLEEGLEQAIEGLDEIERLLSQV